MGVCLHCAFVCPVIVSPVNVLLRASSTLTMIFLNYQKKISAIASIARVVLLGMFGLVCSMMACRMRRPHVLAAVIFRLLASVASFHPSHPCTPTAQKALLVTCHAKTMALRCMVGAHLRKH